MNPEAVLEKTLSTAQIEMNQKVDGLEAASNDLDISLAEHIQALRNAITKPDRGLIAETLNTIVDVVSSSVGGGVKDDSPEYAVLDQVSVIRQQIGTLI